MDVIWVFTNFYDENKKAHLSTLSPKLVLINDRCQYVSKEIQAVLSGLHK